MEAEHVSKERSASLDLLLRFQRLLVSKLYLGVNGTENVNGYSKSLVLPIRLTDCQVKKKKRAPDEYEHHFISFVFADPELLGVGSLLKKYIALLCTHIGDILPVATSIASTGRRHFAEVSRVIEGDLTGNLSIIVLNVYILHA